MRKNLKSKILLSILAASVFYLPAYANAASLTINDDKITASDSVVDDWNIDTLIYHNSSLQNNTITISNKKYNNSQQIFGAYAAQIGRNDGSHTSLAGNIVSIENNSFSNMNSINMNSIVGAYAQFYNGTNQDPPLKFNSTASLQDNSVTISGSTFNGDSSIIGAVGTLYNVYFNGNQTKPTIEPTIEFTGNKVTIGSGTFNAATNVYGAYANLTYPAFNNYFAGTAAMTDNTVTLTGSAGAYDEATKARDLKNVNLYGYGYNDSGTNAAINQDQITAHSNNNLIVDGWSGTVGSVNNFENINFERHSRSFGILH